MVKKPSMAQKLTATQKEFLLFISIPLVLIILVVGLLFVPSLFAHPKYDFLYSDCPTYDCAQVGVSSLGYVYAAPATTTGTVNYYANQQPVLYYYSVKQNSAKQISISQAATYRLDTSSVSPDGYALKQGSSDGGGFLLWGGSSDSNWYLKNGLKSKQINLSTGNSYSSYNAKFVGWVTQ